MRHAHTVEQVRAAEHELMATLPEGAVHTELAEKVLADSDDPKWAGVVKAEKG